MLLFWRPTWSDGEIDTRIAHQQIPTPATIQRRKNGIRGRFTAFGSRSEAYPTLLRVRAASVRSGGVATPLHWWCQHRYR